MEINPLGSDPEQNVSPIEGEKKKTDLEGTKDVIQTSQSNQGVPLTGRVSSKNIKITPQSTPLWNYQTEKKDQKTGKKIFVFSIKDDCNLYKTALKNPNKLNEVCENISRRSMESFPATERQPFQLLHLCPNMKSHKDIVETLEKIETQMKQQNIPTLPFVYDIYSSNCSHFFPLEFGRFLNEIGIVLHVNEDGEMLLEVPEIPLLLDNWEQAQKKYPGLPNLSLALCSGITPDPAFIANYLFYSCTVSIGEELIHDLTQHLIPTMRMMFEGRDGKYIEARKNTNQAVTRLNDLLKKFHDTLLNNKASTITFDVKYISKNVTSVAQKFGNTMTVSEKELCIMQKMLSAAVDGISAIEFLERVEISEGLLSYQKVGNIQRLIKSIVTETPIRELIQQEFSNTNIDDVLLKFNILIKLNL